MLAGVAAALAISIHTLRVEGDLAAFLFFELVIISIHTLRVEGDQTHRRREIPSRYFNPHPPRGG